MNMRRLHRPSRRQDVRLASDIEVPLSIANLEAWYRGDDTVDAAGVVATWTDKSGNARDLTQGTAPARPTPVTRAGQRALSLDGGDILAGAFGVTLTQPTTVYVVWEITSVATAQVILDGNDGTNRIFLYVSNTGPSVRAGAPTEITAGAPSAAQIYASCMVANGVSSALYGRSNFTTAGGSGNAGAASLDGLTVGGRGSDGALKFTGYVWEVLVYSGAHDADTRAQIGAYLTTRYTGLTVT